MVMTTEVLEEELVTRLRAVAEERQSDKIYLRADGAIPYARIMEVMGAPNAAGFNNIVLVPRLAARAWMRTARPWTVRIASASGSRAWRMRG